MKNTVVILDSDSARTESAAAVLRNADYEVRTISKRDADGSADDVIPDLLIAFAEDLHDSSEFLKTLENRQIMPILIIGDAPPTEETSDDTTAEHFRMSFDPIRLATQAARLIERARMKKLVRQKDSRFLSLIENSTDLITVLSANGEIHYESPSAKQILGREPQTNENVNAFDFIHPEDRRRTVAQLKKAVSNPSPSAVIEYRYRHQNGSWRLLESVGRVVEDPSKGKVIVVNSRDITNRRQSEQALRESEERFKAQYNKLKGSSINERKRE